MKDKIEFNMLKVHHDFECKGKQPILPATSSSKPQRHDIIKSPPPKKNEVRNQRSILDSISKAEREGEFSTRVLIDQLLNEQDQGE